MSIFVWLVVGAVIGWAASKIMNAKGGLFRNIVVGIVGSMLGGWIASLIGIGTVNTLSFWGVLISIGGACLLIWLCRLVAGKR